MVSNLAFLTAPYFPTSTPPNPLLTPMNPLAATAYESGASVLEEMRMLKSQVGDIARVCSSVTRGGLSQKVTTPVQGMVMSQLKDVINNMVDKLGQFSKEVARLSCRECSGEVSVPSFEGTWRDLAGIVTKLAAKHISQT
ncbi:histidine kinase osmosensor [Pleurotus ostreatus]|nr:histidine kinase osmosensor [Pleurotus ostreatus]